MPQTIWRFSQDTCQSAILSEDEILAENAYLTNNYARTSYARASIGIAVAQEKHDRQKLALHTCKLLAIRIPLS
jgi:hypothetical protein